MPTYTLSATALANASGKNMLAISNATGSGRVIRIYRIWATNPQTGAVTGGIFYIQLGRPTAVHSGGTALSFLPHSSCVTAGSATPFTGISAVSGATTITSTMETEFRRVARSSDEIAVGTNTLDEWHNIIPLATIWESGYGDSNVEPFVIRPNEGFLIKLDTLGTPGVGTTDIFVELTIETT